MKIKIEFEFGSDQSTEQKARYILINLIIAGAENDSQQLYAN